MSFRKKLRFAWAALVLFLFSGQVSCARRPFEVQISVASPIDVQAPAPEQPVSPPSSGGSGSIQISLKSEPNSTITPEFEIQGLAAGDKVLLLRGADADCVGGSLVGERVAKASALTPIIKSLNPGASETTAEFRAKVIRADGTVECSEAVSASLPSGTLPTNAPYYIQSLPEVRQLAGHGGSSTCGLTPQGTVWCWGWNTWGQLGNGQTGGALNHSLASQVVGLSEVVQISAHGIGSFAALTRSGDIYWWGKLHISSAQQSNVPVLLGHFPSALKLDKGLLLSTDGTLTRLGAFYFEGSADEIVATQVRWFNAIHAESFCTYNQDDSTSCYSYWELAGWSLQQIHGIQNSVGLAASQAFQCALTLGAGGERQASCWTNYPDAQTDGWWAPTYSLTPEVLPISGVRDLYADWYSIYWVTEEGLLYQWGEASLTPQPKADIQQVVSLAPSMIRSCALQEAGTVICWMSY